MASGITKFIKYVCVQDAVYWAPDAPDGYGGMTYKDPVQIKCRWTDTTKTIMDKTGGLVVCRAEVLVVDDLEVDGVLYLGNLTDIEDFIEESTSEYMVNPLSLDTAYTIKRVDKVPLFRSTDEFVRTVYL